MGGAATAEGRQRGPATLQARRRAVRRERILSVAREQFEARPFDEVTIGEIASRVELPAQTVRNYVGSKERLAITCIRQARGELKAELDRIAAEADSAIEQLSLSLERVFLYFRDHASTWIAMIDHGPPFHSELEREVSELRLESQVLISQLLCERRAEEGTVPDAVNTATTAAAIVGALESVALWWKENPHVGVDEIVASMGSTLYGGVPATLGLRPLGR